MSASAIGVFVVKQGTVAQPLLHIMHEGARVSADQRALLDGPLASRAAQVCELQRLGAVGMGACVLPWVMVAA